MNGRAQLPRSEVSKPNDDPLRRPGAWIRAFVWTIGTLLVPWAWVYLVAVRECNEPGYAWGIIELLVLYLSPLWACLGIAAFLGGLASSVSDPTLVDRIAGCVLLALLALVLVHFAMTPQGIRPCANL